MGSHNWDTGEVRPVGGRYLSADKKFYHDAHGKVIETVAEEKDRIAMAQAAAQTATEPDPGATNEAAPPAEAEPVKSKGKR